MRQIKVKKNMLTMTKKVRNQIIEIKTFKRKNE